MSEWANVKLKDLCLSITDGDHQAPPKSDTGIPFITISNLNSTHNTIDFTGCSFVPEEYYASLTESRQPKQGDVLYSAVGSFGIPILVKDDSSFVFQRHIAILRPGPNVCPAFLAYVMKSREFYHWADNVAIGAAQRTVTLKQLREKEIAVPSLKTQEHMASILSAYDELIENNRKQIKLLEEAAQRLYKEWFIDFKFPGYETTPIDPETSLPEGWKRTTIGNEFSITTGKRDANYGARDGLYPFFTCAREPIAATNYSFDTEAIILAGNGDLYSRLFRGKFEAYQRTYVIEPREKSYLFIGGKRVENEIIQLKAKAAGSTIKYLTKGMIESIEILLPSSAVLAKFNNMYEAIQSKMESLENSISLTAEVRDRLLPKLMSGEIEVS